MKNFLTICKISMLSLMFLALFSTSLVAQNNFPRPTKLKLIKQTINCDSSSNFNSISFSWSMAKNGSTPLPEKYWVNLSDDLSHSSPICIPYTIIEPDSVEYLQNENVYYYHDLPIGDYGLFAMSLSAIYSDGESYPSNEILFDFIEPVYIKFTSQPSLFGKKNVAYTYTLTAKSTIRGTLINGENITITPKSMPDAATFDTLTNTLTWTPTTSGHFPFQFEGKGLFSGAIGYQEWSVYVPTCEVPAKVSGIVKDKKGNLMENGMIKLLLYFSDDSSSIRPQVYYEAEIVNGTYEISDLDSGTYWILASGDDFSYGKIEEPIKITVGCGDVATQDIVVTKYSDYQMKITSTPEITAKVNESYQYQIEVEVEGESEVVLGYELMYGPSNAVINQTTGLLTWTPTQNGTVDFQIRVYNTENEYSQDYQYWSVNVNACDVPGVLIANIVYEDGTPITNGRAVIFLRKLYGSDSINNIYPRVYKSDIIDGKATFTNIDKGGFYLLFNLYDQKNVKELWYENANNMNDATLINVDCGDTVVVTMTVDKPVQVVMRTISGTVYRDSTDEVVPNARVDIFTRDYKGVDDPTTFTDANGNYVFLVPDNKTYTVRASAYINIPGTPTIVLMPQYYDGVSSLAEATVLEPTTDLTGIDFYLHDKPSYTNSISGKITDDTDNPVEGAHVIIYRVGPKTNSVEDNWYGHNAITNSLGEYTVTNLSPGNYIVFAMGDKNSDNFPGYYKAGEPSTWNWSDATRLPMLAKTVLTNINVQIGTNKKMLGTGKIIGYVGNEDGKAVVKGGGTENALNGANVYAADVNGVIFNGTYSNSTGEFSIQNLPIGSYTIMADKVGFEGYVVGIEITEAFQEVSAYVPLEPKDINDSVEDEIAGSAMLYPNPTNEDLNIVFSGVYGSANISLFNVLGNEVFTQTANVQTGLNSIHLDLPILPTGSYYAKINNNGILIVLPFVVR